MQLPFIGGTLWVLPNVTTQLGDYKEYYRCLRRYMLSWRISRLGFVTPIVGEVSLALSVMHIIISLASNVTK